MNRPLDNPLERLVCNRCKDVIRGDQNDKCSKKCPYCQVICQGHLINTIIGATDQEIIWTSECKCDQSKRTRIINNLRLLFEQHLSKMPLWAQKIQIEKELDRMNSIRSTTSLEESKKQNLRGELIQVNDRLFKIDKQIKMLILEKWYG